MAQGSRQQGTAMAQIRCAKPNEKNMTNKTNENGGRETSYSELNSQM